MAGSKKKVKQKVNPSSHKVAQSENPDIYLKYHPSWKFNNSDTEQWSFTKEKIGNKIWDDIIPYLKNIETQTWSEILIKAKKQNHSIDVNKLSKRARDRLEELHIEEESLISLRINGVHRIYGFFSDIAVLNILWYDTNHGDNDTCVCRSSKKHT